METNYQKKKSCNDKQRMEIYAIGIKILIFLMLQYNGRNPTQKHTETTDNSKSRFGFVALAGLA